LATAPPLVGRHLESGIDSTAVDFGGAGQVRCVPVPTFCAAGNSGAALESWPKFKVPVSRGLFDHLIGHGKQDQQTGGARSQPG
jgi:hypothetical protein